MTPQRHIIRLLDNPGLRPVLAMLATRYARWKTGLDVGVFYDGAWIHRADDYYLAESATFFWNAAQLACWRPHLGEILDIHQDWWFYQYQPKEGDIVVDIGAGNGEDALLFSKAVGKRGRVLAVEAHPVTFQLLQKSCEYNQLNHNTVLVQCALMDKPGSIRIENRAHYGSTVQLANDQSPASSTVMARTLDELCAAYDIPHIDLLKINIEGAERCAIQGMSHIVKQTRAVCIACHDFRGAEGDFYRTKALIIDYVRTHGFEVAIREQHPEPWARDHVYGIRTSQADRKRPRA